MEHFAGLLAVLAFLVLALREQIILSPHGVYDDDFLEPVRYHGHPCLSIKSTDPSMFDNVFVSEQVLLDMIHPAHLASLALVIPSIMVWISQKEVKGSSKRTYTLVVPTACLQLEY